MNSDTLISSSGAAFLASVIADFGYDGGVVGFEVLEASKVVEKAGERSREDASDIDGQNREVEWAGAHESNAVRNR